MIDTTGTEIETETGMPSEVDIRTGGQDGERGAKERRGEELRTGGNEQTREM
jgi:hypothetical protein